MSGSENEDQEFILLDRAISPEDVNQEMEVLKLLGIPFPNRGFVTRRLQGESSELLFDYLPDSREFEPVDNVFEGDIHSLLSLIEWAKSQDNHLVRIIIARFMEDPEELLEPTLYELVRLGVIHKNVLKKNPKKEKTVTLVSQILNNLPTTKERLYELASSFCIGTTRPAASVRQSLRRLLSNGTIYLDEKTHLYHLTNSTEKNSAI